MAKKILNSANVTKLDVINSESSERFERMPAGSVVTGAAIVEEPDTDTGEVKTYAYLYTDKGVYAGNSATVGRAVDALCDLINDEPSIKYSATIHTKTSNNGREFLTITFAECPAKH